MFVLAHLSDPHLAPLPRPRAWELAGKRALGFANWLRRRREHHRAEVLDTIIRDLNGVKPDHVALTGDLVNIALDREFAGAYSAYRDGRDEAGGAAAARRFSLARVTANREYRAVAGLVVAFGLLALRMWLRP